MGNLPYIDCAEEAAVDAICSEFDGKGYHKQLDCIHFSAKVMDRLSGSNKSESLRSPRGLSPKEARKVIRWFLRQYGLVRVEPPLKAGDLVLLRDRHRRLSHMMVVGNARLWHANPPRVSFCGLSLPPETSLSAVYRLPACSRS